MGENGIGAKCKRSSEVHICIERKAHEVSMSTGQGNDEQFLHLKQVMQVIDQEHTASSGIGNCIVWSNALQLDTT